MATMGPAPGVVLPFPDMIKGLKERSLSAEAFIWLVKAHGDAATRAVMRSGAGGPGGPDALPQTPDPTFEERERRVLHKP